MLRNKARPTRSASVECRNMQVACRPGVTGSQLRAATHARPGVLRCTAVLPRGNNSSSSNSGPLTRPLSSSFKQSVSHSHRFSSMRRHVLPPLAMVNVDFASPSLVLGVTLIGCGIALLQVRNMQREVSRDADIVVAAMISIVGSTLIFQGWRLDPLLLLCQALTTSVAFWYGLEAFKLRAEVVQEEDPNMNGQQMPPLQDMPGMQQPTDYNSSTYNSSNAGRPGYLPPGADRPAPWAQQQQQQAGGYGPGSNARWGLPPGQQSVPFDAYAGSSSGSGMGAGMPPDATYAGYEAAADSSVQQQYGSSGGYGSSAYDPSVYSAPQPGQQQQQQYEWPAQGNYGQQQPPVVGPPYMQQQQQPVWYDAAGVPMAAGPAAGEAYGAFQGLADPYIPAAGMGALPDGSSLLPGAYGTGDGSGLGLPPLPPPADGQQQGSVAPAQQQQQQQQQRRGRNAYEQVDDWE